MGDTRITEDPRIDPRIKALFGAVDISRSSDDVDAASRSSRRPTPRRRSRYEVW